MDTPDELTGPFAEAVAATLREMAGVEAVVRDAGRATGGEVLADVSTVLRLDADAPGWVILSLPRGTADALARRVLADVGEPDDGMVRDCAAELLNVIAGQAKSLVFGTPFHFTLSTPAALAAGPAGGWVSRAVVRFESDAGPFTLHLLPPRAAGAGGAAASEG